MVSREQIGRALRGKRGNRLGSWAGLRRKAEVGSGYRWGAMVYRLGAVERSWVGTPGADGEGAG